MNNNLTYEFLQKKVIFENFVTYEGLHGQRRYVAKVLRWTLISESTLYFYASKEEWSLWFRYVFYVRKCRVRRSMVMYDRNDVWFYALIGTTAESATMNGNIGTWLHFQSSHICRSLVFRGAFRIRRCRIWRDDMDCVNGAKATVTEYVCRTSVAIAQSSMNDRSIGPTLKEDVSSEWEDVFYRRRRHRMFIRIFKLD